MDMTDEVKRVAPGCFGAASVFSGDSQVCQRCPAFRECEGASYETLLTIRGTINVDDLLARHRKAMAGVMKQSRPEPPRAAAEASRAAEAGKVALSRHKPATKPAIPEKVERAEVSRPIPVGIDAETRAILDTLNVKPRELAEKLARRGTFKTLRADLQAGRNTLENEKPAFAALTCSLLINGGLTRALLKQAYIDTFGWSAATAGSHINIILPALIAFGIAKETSDGITLILE